MVTQQLVEYIQNQLRSGQNPESIKQILRGHGWGEDDIGEAFFQASGASSQSPIASPGNQPVRQDFAFDAQAHVAVSGTGDWFSGKKKLISIIASVVVLLGGGGYAAYSYVTSSPQALLQKMFETLPTVQTVQGTASISAAWKDASAPLSLTSLMAPSGQRQAVAHEATNTLELDVTSFINLIQTQTNQFVFSASTTYAGGYTNGTPVHVGIDLGGSENLFYAKLSGLRETLTALIPVPLDVSFLDNQWIKVDTTQAAAQAKDMGLTNATSSGPTFFQKLSTPDVRAKVIAILKNSKAIQSMTKVGDESIDGVPTAHIALVINGPEFLKTVQDLAVLAGVSTSTPVDPNGPLQALDIWIGTSDYLPHKVVATLNANAIMHTNANGTSATQFSFLTVGLSRLSYNVPFSFTPPQNSITVEDAAANLFGQLFGAAFQGQTQAPVSPSPRASKK